MQRRLCDIDSGKKRSIDLDEKQVRKKRITMMNSQYESRQTLDLFFGHGVEAHNDFHFGEPCLYNVRAATCCVVSKSYI